MLRTVTCRGEQAARLWVYLTTAGPVEAGSSYVGDLHDTGAATTKEGVGQQKTRASNVGIGRLKVEGAAAVGEHAALAQRRACRDAWHVGERC